MNKIIILIVLLFTNFSQAQDKVKIIQGLQKLYPYLSPQSIAQTVEVTNTPAELIRFFIPYYYLSLKGNPKLLKDLIVLKNEYGWCAGDAHLTNFGTLINKHGQSLFTLNDVDDSGPCPLITDVLKLLVDLNYSLKKVPLVSIVRSYADGLALNHHNFSKTTEKLLNKSEHKGATLDEDLLVGQAKLKRKKYSAELSKTEISELKLLLTRTYSGKVTLLDAFAATKVAGGSHGLLRIITLVKFESIFKKQLQILEFKQQVQPGIFPLAAGPIPHPKLRIAKTWQLVMDNDLSPFYTVVRYLNFDMLIRPLWDGHIKIVLGEASQEELLDLAHDAAYQLGVLHSKTAPKTYLPKFGATTLNQWEEALGAITAYFIDAFKTLKSN